jgi:feruloyl esterase
LATRSFGSDVNITATLHVPARAGASNLEGNATSLPSHCLVSGMINERAGAGGKTYGIGFELALPDQWNGRFLLQGGGGLNGTVRPPIGPVAAGDRPALARGFAVVSHDSGHKGPGFDGSFLADQRAALDFAETSVRTVTLLSKEITSAFYGAPALRSYMTGCSTGGREGMLASQRYPELFDGIIVGAPAMRTGDSNLGIEYSSVQFNQAAPRDASGLPIVDQIFSAADRTTILNGMLEQCDALDGLADGMIMNVGQCRFGPKRLQCSTAQRDDCLSPAQVVRWNAHSPVLRTRREMRSMLRSPTTRGLWTPRQRSYATSPAAIQGRLDRLPGHSKSTWTPAYTRSATRLGSASPDTSYWTNLNTFLLRGGKIMFFHGVSDPWFSPFATLDYWQRASETNGARWSEASRLYMNPGMGHCGGGNAYDQFDLPTPLMDWVENGKVPGTIASWRTSAPEDPRPLCPHPSYAHFLRGGGKRMASFECRSPA